MKLSVQNWSWAHWRFVFPVTKQKCFLKRGCLTGYHLVITFIHLEMNLRSEFQFTGGWGENWIGLTQHPASYPQERQLSVGHERQLPCTSAKSELGSVRPEHTAGLGSVALPLSTWSFEDKLDCPIRRPSPREVFQGPSFGAIDRPVFGESLSWRPISRS